MRHRWDGWLATKRLASSKVRNVRCRTRRFACPLLLSVQEIAVTDDGMTARAPNAYRPKARKSYRRQTRQTLGLSNRPKPLSANVSYN